MAGLHGMKEICGYSNRSEPTILEWIKTKGFPAVKVRGCWESDTDLIDGWRKEQILNSVGKSNKN